MALIFIAFVTGRSGSIVFWGCPFVSWPSLKQTSNNKNRTLRQEDGMSRIDLVDDFDLSSTKSLKKHVEGISLKGKLANNELPSLKLTFSPPKIGRLPQKERNVFLCHQFSAGMLVSGRVPFSQNSEQKLTLSKDSTYGLPTFGQFRG